MFGHFKSHYHGQVVSASGLSFLFGKLLVSHVDQQWSADEIGRIEVRHHPKTQKKCGIPLLTCTYFPIQESETLNKRSDPRDLTVFLSRSGPSGSDGSDLPVVGRSLNGGVCVPDRRVCAVEYFRSVAGTGYIMAHEEREYSTHA